VILAVDAGNSRVKWALYDGRTFVREGWVAHADIGTLAEAWARLPVPSSIVVANVAGDTVRAGLERLFVRWQTGIQWISATRTQCGITSRYDDPAQLGADRWASLIGARQLVSGACLVVNVGTAMTVDALTAQGEFLGGIIVPGFDLMHEALAANTACLSAERGKFAPFPLATADAITSGAIQALCGAVERMRLAMLEAGQGEPTLVFGGGAGGIVAQRLGRPVRVVERLVLEGLVRIGQEPG
jgi:type III pantothenate kinase